MFLIIHLQCKCTYVRLFSLRHRIFLSSYYIMFILRFVLPERRSVSSPLFSFFDHVMSVQPSDFGKVHPLQVVSSLIS